MFIERLRERLNHYVPSEIPSPPEIRASVVIPLYRAGEEEFVVLTKRTLSVKSHPGEISFPGGMYESADGDSRTTALRECCEEIGVAGGDIDVLGRLDDERTLTGFVITPFVGVIPFPYSFSLSTSEVDYLIHFPLGLLARSRPVVEKIEYKGDFREIHAIYHGGERIWGATCRLLLKLKQIMGD